MSTYGPQHNAILHEGYAVGYTKPGSEWLCVYSSAYCSRLLFPTPEDARARLDWLGDIHEAVSIRKVRREGQTYFRLLD